MEYTVVENVKDAEYWVAYVDDGKDFLKDSITVGKVYKLELVTDMFGEDYFFKDDKDYWSMAYMIHRGDFIKLL